MFKYLILILLTIIKIFSTTCCDGSYSSSSGRGTCSHHGGVCNGTTYYNTTPSIPTGLKINYINNQTIKLTWNNSYSSSFYEIYYSPTCNSTYSYLDNVYSNSYTTSLAIDTCFKIKSCTYSSCSSYSNYIQGKNKTTFNYDSNTFRIIDGDTIELSDRTCRLHGIDTPETDYSSKLYNDAKMCQIDEDVIKKSGNEAKKFIETIIKNQDLEVEIIGKDKYSRDVCDIKLSNGKNLNEQLVKEGYAIVWKEYIKNNTLLNTYLEYQDTARKSLKGLWSNSFNVMSCLSDKKSIFKNNKELYFYDIIVSNKNLENDFEELNFNYQNHGDNKFILNSNSNFELTEDKILISDDTDNITVYSNGQVKILNQITIAENLDNNHTIAYHDFNSSIIDDTLEYTQTIDKNIIKYFIDDSLQFIIYYFKNSLMSIEHKNSSKFKNDMNISTNSKVWVDNQSNTKSLYISTISSSNIKF